MALPSPNQVAQQRLQPHMPKLQYRNSSTVDVSADSITTISSSFSASNGPSSSTTSSGLLDHCFSPGCVTVSHDALISADSQSRSANPSLPTTQISAKRSKKKGKSFFNFFSVKEPSQQALEDYQRHMRKNGNSSDGRSPSIGLVGVSSAKMPPTVPKVNSKWDGVPQALKEKEKAKDEGSRSFGTYSRSISTARSDRSTNTFSSLSSRGSRPRYKLPSGSDNSLADLYGWEKANTLGCCHDQIESKGLQGIKNLPSRAKSATSLPEGFLVRSQTPPLPSFPPNLPKNYLEVQLPQLRSKSCVEWVKTTEDDIKKPFEPPAQCFSPALTPPEVSPVTPNMVFSVADSVVPMVIKVPYTQTDYDAGNGIRTTTIDVPGPNQNVNKSTRIQFLDPRGNIKGKEKYNPFPASEATELTVSWWVATSISSWRYDQFTVVQTRQYILINLSRYQASPLLWKNKNFVRSRLWLQADMNLGCASFSIHSWFLTFSRHGQAAVKRAFKGCSNLHPSTFLHHWLKSARNRLLCLSPVLVFCFTLLSI